MIGDRLMRLLELFQNDETMVVDEGEPSLVAAVRHNGRIYKGEPGQAHWDVAKAQGLAGPSWKDRPDIETGFVNHKGHFLNRERALAYALKHDMLHPMALKYLADPETPAELGASFIKRAA